MSLSAAHAANTCAVILAGGKNLRMQGTHKLFLKLGGETLFSLIHRTVSPQVKQTVLSFNDDHPELQGISTPVIKDFPSNTMEGPLAGIVSSLTWLDLQQSDAEWLLSIPGDTPILPSDLLQQLSHASAQAGSIACFSSYQNRKHFLTALWHRSVLPMLADYLNTRQRSAKGVLAKINACTTDIKHSNNTSEQNPSLLFFNINTPADLSQASQLYETQARTE